MRRLIIRPGAIGDLIVSLPALEFLRADYTEVWVPASNTPLIRFAHLVRAISSTGLDLLELNRAPENLKQHLSSFDSIVSWYGASRPEFRACVQGLPFEFHAALPHDSSLHATDFYLQQVGAGLGAVPQIQLPQRPREDFIAIHPYSGAAKKNWPLDRFRKLARGLGSALWTAGPEESLAGLDPDVRRFSDLYDLALWLKRAKLYIGNDSGITHLAAAVGTPVIALFGPTDPKVWAPRGPCVEVIRHQPLEELALETVASVAGRLLAAPIGRGPSH